MNLLMDGKISPEELHVFEAAWSVCAFPILLCLLVWYHFGRHTHLGMTKGSCFETAKIHAFLKIYASSGELDERPSMDSSLGRGERLQEQIAAMFSIDEVLGLARYFKERLERDPAQDELWKAGFQAGCRAKPALQEVSLRLQAGS